jgi:biotin carboxyl carrier protein
MAEMTDGTANPRAVRVTVAQPSGGDLDGHLEMTTAPNDEAAVLAQRQVTVGDEGRDLTLRALGSRRHLLSDGDERHVVILEEPRAADRGSVREVLVDGFRFDVTTEPAHLAALRERARRDGSAGATSGPLDVRAIIPGRILAVSVEVGERVSAGQQLVVIEAMKMQNELKAPRDGTIDRVGVTPGVNIEVGDLLVVIS